MQKRPKAILWFLLVCVTADLAFSQVPRGDSKSPQGLLREELFADLHYRFVGPTRGGRVTAVAGHRAQPSTFYLGASGGGVWKTTDSGQKWTPVSDGYFQTGSIGAIRVSESDPSLLYVGTGSDGLRSNVIVGKGVYKSTDGGQSWSHVGLENVGNIGAVLIHPRNPDLVYVAAIGNPFAANPERGIFRTLDGGRTWDHVLFLSEKTGAVDLEFAPDNPEEIYAALWEARRKPWTIISGGSEGGVHKSSDGGEGWIELTQGLPQGLRGKADLAVSAGDPNRVYVLIEAPGSEGGLYRSDDRGASWRQISDFQPIRNRPFYYTNLEAHPWNPDILWAMAEGFWKSEDAGQTWKRRLTPHGDNHDLWINPDNPDRMVQANDGGANVTMDGGEGWSSQNNQGTAELYQVAISDEFPYRLYAGQQDNTTISVPSLPSLSHPAGPTGYWEAHGGCETGPAVPKPGDPDIVFANCKGRFGVFHRRTGQEQQYYVGFQNLYGHNPKDLEYRFQRVAPIHVSPHNSNRVYHGSQFVHVTEDGGISWKTISPDLTAFSPETQVVSGYPITRDVTGEEHFSTLYEIQESPHEAGVIWVGANDGPIHLTRNGGKNWVNVTPQEVGPYGRVQTIEVSPHLPGKAYACILRYQLGDFSPYVFRTTDYGATWSRVTTGRNGIPPDYPVRVIREDPVRPGLLYAGTEFGIFFSSDDGDTWRSFQRNLPVTPITDIQIAGSDLVLSTMGRGFWILDNLGPLREQGTIAPAQPFHLLKVEDAYRLRCSEYGVPGESHEPFYPEPGVDVDYYLAEDTQLELQIQILDSNGKTVRHFSSAPEDSGKGSEPGSAPKENAESSLPTQLGFHRFKWDLRHSGPVLSEGSRGRRGRGPMAAPGEYKVRFWFGEETSERSFQLLMDPRVMAEGITPEMVTAQVRLLLDVRGSLEVAQSLAGRVQARLKIQEPGLSSAAQQDLKEIEKLLVTDSVRYSQPMLIDQLEYLYSNLDQADQLPGQDAYARYSMLQRELDNLSEKANAILAR